MPHVSPLLRDMGFHSLIPLWDFSVIDHEMAVAANSHAPRCGATTWPHPQQTPAPQGQHKTAPGVSRGKRKDETNSSLCRRPLPESEARRQLEPRQDLALFRMFCSLPFLRSRTSNAQRSLSTIDPSTCTPPASPNSSSPSYQTVIPNRREPGRNPLGTRRFTLFQCFAGRGGLCYRARGPHMRFRQRQLPIAP